MADRDRIPSSIPRQYRGLYKQVCEQQAPIAIAQSALRPLSHNAKALGNGPVNLLSKATDWLKPMVEKPLFRKVVDWDKEHQKIDDFVKETGGNLDGIEWASRAYHQILIKLQANKQIQDIKFEMFKQYLLNIYVAQFEESIPQLPQHHADAGQETIEECLDLVRPYLEQEIGYLAEQLVKHSNVNSLSLPDRTKPTEELLDEDIMQGIAG